MVTAARGSVLLTYVLGLKDFYLSSTDSTSDILGKRLSSFHDPTCSNFEATLSASNLSHRYGKSEQNYVIDNMVSQRQKGSKGSKGKKHWNSHHPSQSSLDEPQKTKDEVKTSQNYKCWLCGQKAHKIRRPLQICHIYPQAAGRKYQVSNEIKRKYFV